MESVVTVTEQQTIWVDEDGNPVEPVEEQLEKQSDMSVTNDAPGSAEVHHEAQQAIQEQKSIPTYEEAPESPTHGSDSAKTSRGADSTVDDAHLASLHKIHGKLTLVTFQDAQE
jgi:hypothetical protein